MVKVWIMNNVVMSYIGNEAIETIVNAMKDNNRLTSLKFSNYAKIWIGDTNLRVRGVKAILNNDYCMLSSLNIGMNEIMMNRKELYRNRRNRSNLKVSSIKFPWHKYVYLILV